MIILGVEFILVFFFFSHFSIKKNGQEIMSLALVLFRGTYVKTPLMVGGWNEVCHWFYKVGASSRTDELINQLLNTPRRCYRKCSHLGSFILLSSRSNLELSAELELHHTFTNAAIVPFQTHILLQGCFRLFLQKWHFLLCNIPPVPSCCHASYIKRKVACVNRVRMERSVISWQCVILLLFFFPHQSKLLKRFPHLNENI